jgi:hypothetical protein
LSELEAFIVDVFLEGLLIDIFTLRMVPIHIQSSIFSAISFLDGWGGFHKSWAHVVKRKAHPNLGENAISWA